MNKDLNYISLDNKYANKIHINLSEFNLFN